MVYVLGNDNGTCNQGIDAQIPTQFLQSLNTTINMEHESSTLFISLHLPFNSFNFGFRVLLLASFLLLIFFPCALLSIRLFTCCCCVHIYSGAKPKWNACMCALLLLSLVHQNRTDPNQTKKVHTFSFYCRARLSSIYVRFCDCVAGARIFNVIEARFETFKWIFIRSLSL